MKYPMPKNDNYELKEQPLIPLTGSKGENKTNATDTN